MLGDRYKALKCMISRGGFSDERVFTLRLGIGECDGVASRQYLWDENWSPLEEGEPPLGKQIEGWVAARVVEVRSDGMVVALLPDGQTVEVPIAALVTRPSGVGTHVPLGS